MIDSSLVSSLPPRSAIRAEIARRAKADLRARLESDREGIRHRCESLVGFIREAWRVLEPTANYVHNWHIDTICLPADAQITTREGRKAIGDIVKDRWSGDVLSANHKTGVLEWKPVIGWFGSPGKCLVKIETSDGNSLKLTGNHPIFVVGKGYVPAGDISGGETVVEVRELQRGVRAYAANGADTDILFEGLLSRASEGAGRGALNSTVRLVRETVLSQSVQAAWRILQHGMPWCVKGHSRAEALSPLRKPEGMGRQELPQVLRRIKTDRQRHALPTVRSASLSFASAMGGFFSEAWGLLQSEMPRTFYARREQSGIHRRRIAAGLSEGISGGPQASFGARRRALLSLLESGSAGCPSHRPESAQQRGVEPRNVVSEMPQSPEGNARTGIVALCGIVSKVERCPQLPDAVFNIEVGNNNNYFADGVLVHNCEHLEAVTDGRITRLLINVPPGSMKSLLVSVLWPAWEWGPKGLRSMRYLATSFSDGPVKRDTRKSRDLILSEWYQTLWPEVQLTRTAETSFANTSTGTREGVAFGSMTSQRGDRVIIDDPHSVETAESEVQRETTTRLFRERAVFSVNDPLKSAVIVIMQRLHENDISGVILSHKMDFVHLRLPMEFEAENRCETILGVADPRRVEGELLDYGRSPEEVVVKLKRDMTSYAVAGQLQQRPVPREGGLFKRHWFDGKIIRPEAIPYRTTWVRHWDLAASTRKTSARTAGVKMGRAPDGTFIIGHVIVTQSEGREVRGLISATAQQDGVSTKISLPQDPGQAGKVQAQDMIAMLAGYVVHAEPETGDKVIRAEPFSAQCEGGNVRLVEGEWVQSYLDELCMFPGGAFKDRVDASSGAFGALMQITGPMKISDAAVARSAIPFGNQNVVLKRAIERGAGRGWNDY